MRMTDIFSNNDLEDNPFVDDLKKSNLLLKDKIWKLEGSLRDQLTLKTSPELEFYK